MAMRIDAQMAGCSFPGCDRGHHSMGYCKGHRQQQYRGRPLTSLRPCARRKSCRLCDGIVWRQGLCSAHYPGEYRGDQKRLSTSVEERLAELIGPPDRNGCQAWLGTPRPDGYGYFHLNGKHHLAHRVVYRVTTGSPLNEGEVIHHTCANRWCVSPNHLQAVSHHENLAEMVERKFYQSRIAELERENQWLMARVGELEAGLQCGLAV
ncbi:MAG: hypothetical protein A4E20_10805 [Nitrospira sp. SG-bin2]|uniref:HNH endonuclease signature motif containing protein n=1 Tax=Nitrospira cf. moscoviensis SBR1015 TaxID=96242 RepID=UPI000A0A34DE|nr:HNH endonuclease signature motif containing protein [Nitrospira cf. moscoviensis SBR1015]OQW34501.1 MAG: hypothetical protein A4E20_10805 [Nitrospira sp. SG-bin2]